MQVKRAGANSSGGSKKNKGTSLVQFARQMYATQDLSMSQRAGAPKDSSALGIAWMNYTMGGGNRMS